MSRKSYQKLSFFKKK